MRELESRFGVQLIKRMGKQAHATVPGQQLVEVAQRIFEECNAAEAIMRRYRKGWLGRVRVGTMLTVLTYRLPPILRRLRAERPDIELVVNNMPTQDGVANVLANKMSLALVSLPVEDKSLRVTPLRGEMMMAILPPDTRDVPDAITPEYVARQPLLTERTRSSGYTLVLGWLGRVKMEREPMPIGTVDTLKAAVADKLGMALVPEAAITKHKAGFIVRPLQPPLGRTLALIEHRNKPNDPGAGDRAQSAAGFARGGEGRRGARRRRAESGKAPGSAQNWGDAETLWLGRGSAASSKHICPSPALGGSEIAVSPSTLFYTGLEYLVFFDELDEENKVIGFDYYASLLSQITDERLQTIRDEADKARAIELAVPMFHSQLPRISNPLYNVSNVNVTNVMKYQWERPEGSGNFSDVWRVEIRCEGFEEDGDHVWRAIMFHVVLDTGEVGVGPIVGNNIEDSLVEDDEIVEEVERNNWGQTPAIIGFAVLLLLGVFLVLIQKVRN